MTEQELYQIVRREIDARASTDPVFRQHQKNIDMEKGNFTDSAQCSRLLSNFLGEELAKRILELPPNEGRSEVCQRLLKDHFDEISRNFEQVQSNLDREKGIQLQTQFPEFPAERAKTVGDSLKDTTVSNETIQRRCRNAVSNVANSMHDNFIKENAKIRHDLGLKPIIQRFGSGCCKWCAEISGKYRFGEQPDDIFRRHDNCTCIIIYDTQVLRGAKTENGGRSKTWTEVSPEEVIAEGFTPTAFTQEEARQLEQSQLSQIARLSPQQARNLNLTTGGNGGRIGIASNAHSRDEELEKIIQDCIKQERPCFADDLARNFSRIKPEENRYIMALHGNPSSTFLYGKKVDARTLANIIRSRKDYNGTDEIVLISCNTGNEENTRKCFAQKLADELDVTVYAPTKYDAIGAFGHYYSSTEKGVRDGEFKPFKPTPKNKKE